MVTKRRNVPNGERLELEGELKILEEFGYNVSSEDGSEDDETSRRSTFSGHGIDRRNLDLFERPYKNVVDEHKEGLSSPKEIYRRTNNGVREEMCPRGSRVIEGTERSTVWCTTFVFGKMVGLRRFILVWDLDLRVELTGVVDTTCTVPCWIIPCLLSDHTPFVVPNPNIHESKFRNVTVTGRDVETVQSPSLRVKGVDVCRIKDPNSTPCYIWVRVGDYPGTEGWWHTDGTENHSSSSHHRPRPECFEKGQETVLTTGFLVCKVT